jgi:hypothetical protein
MRDDVAGPDGSALSDGLDHTPGPWHWDDGKDKDMPKLMAPSGKVCDFGNDRQYYPTAGEPPNEADSRLIAAAPDLLKALQMLYDETADYIRMNNLGGMDNQCMQLARAALARAVGAAQREH